MTKQEISSQKMYPRPPIKHEDFQFAKNIFKKSFLPDLRPDNFCINLVEKDLEHWTSTQCRAFAKLYCAFANEAADLLKIKQNERKNVDKDPQYLLLKLPKPNDGNRIALHNIYNINNIFLKHGFVDSTGNENAITLSKNINFQKENPITPFVKVRSSVSVVIIVEDDTNSQVLLLKRGGQSARKDNWGTLTGTIEKSDTTHEDTLVREVHEEINFLLESKKAHYVGVFYTKDMAKDLVDKGKQASFADDFSHVYGVKIPKEELMQTIQLNEENSKWKLFSREELCQFKVHVPDVHGTEYDAKEMHVAAAKSLLVLNCAANNFESIQQAKFNYPYTNSPGFFAYVKESGSKKEPQDENLNTIKIL